MIKKIIRNNSLNSRINEFSIFDNSLTSSEYFRLDIPDKFYIGKNSLSIYPSKKLLPNSKIEIDIYDYAGNNVYYEITNVILLSNSRLISVYIYPDIPYGEITIYVGGTLSNGQTVLWSREIPLTYTEVTSAPIHSSAPIVTTTELMYSKMEQSNSRFTVISPNNNKLNLLRQSDQQPIQLNQQNSVLDLKNKNLQPIYPPISSYSSITSSIDNQINLIESLANNTQTTNYSVNVNTSAYDVMTTSSSFFSASMVGGEIKINLFPYFMENDNFPPNLPESYKNAFIWSGSIVDVISNKKILVYPNFSWVVKNDREIIYNLTAFSNVSNFTCSYYDYNITGSNTAGSQSYLYFDVKNLDTVSGKVSDIDVSYKPNNFIGEYIPLSSYNVNRSNFLIDSRYLQNFRNDFGFKQIGKPHVEIDVQTFWTSSIFNVSSSGFDYRDGTSNNSIVYLYHGKIHNERQYVELYTTSSYDFIGYKNTEYHINFSYDIDNTSNDDTKPQIDIYLSGSDISSDKSYSVHYTPIQYTDRYYVGSIIGNNRMGYSNISFITNQSKKNKLFFVIRGHHWSLRNVEIITKNNFGFTPNHVYFIVPTPTNISNDEILLKLKYRNSNNYSNFETDIIGLLITGSTT